AGASQAYAATYVAQVSPTFPNIAIPTDVVTSYNYGPYETSSTLSSEELSGFPASGQTPSTSSAEVVAAYDSIDWTKVPSAPVRKQDSNGNWIFSGDWGLTYDDGPFIKVSGQTYENSYAEPRLYNFLAETNQKATLFYIGSNVAAYPAAAKRALNNGHQLCVHTWSHQPMTTLTNKQVVAELYWGLKAIKAATGVTPKCWRPPQGDVDDRVRAIAYQLGMRTILWNEDTNDWDIGEGTSAKTVDKYFQTWINDYKAGKDTTGLVVLEHELSSKTVNMSMFWMPKLQETFNVIPALACNDITQPYWETDFVYPTTNIRPTATKTTTTSVATTKTTSTATATATCISGSSGKKNGDGYNGYCCTSSDDCLDTCVKGKCNGPTNTKITTSSTTTKKATTTTTTKKATTTTTSGASSCTPGVSGKKNGTGKTGYCCTSSDDCLETCRSGKCGL
ncbi:hypothetical protein CU098_001544, partial [Rhizopus stolonifer]